MAHNLEMLNGQAQMAYVGETPWHGLGTQVEADITVDGMIKAAGLDWTVTKAPTFFRIGDKEVETGKFALVRENDNKFLSNVSGSWEPCQNVDAFSVFEEFVDRNELEMNTAGSLKGGQIVWGLAKMKDSFALFDDDLTEQYLLLVNPHVFGQGIHVRSTPIRVVCNNTLSLSLGQASNVQATQNHRSAFDAEMMKEAIGIAREKLTTYREMAEFIAKKKYNDESLKRFMTQVFPTYSKKEEEKVSRNALRALEVVETQPGAEYGKGTWWQAFNAVTYLCDHEFGRNQDTRLQSAWFGANKDRKNQALEKAVEFAEAA